MPGFANGSSAQNSPIKKELHSKHLPYGSP